MGCDYIYITYSLFVSIICQIHFLKYGRYLRFIFFSREISWIINFLLKRKSDNTRQILKRVRRYRVMRKKKKKIRKSSRTVTRETFSPSFLFFIFTPIKNNIAKKSILFQILVYSRTCSYFSKTIKYILHKIYAISFRG